MNTDRNSWAHDVAAVAIVVICIIVIGGGIAVAAGFWGNSSQHRSSRARESDRQTRDAWTLYPDLSSDGNLSEESEGDFEIRMPDLPTEYYESDIATSPLVEKAFNDLEDTASPVEEK